MLFHVPTFPNPDLVVRVAQHPTEVQLANALVFRNYVAQGYWQDDRGQLDCNRFLHLPTRHVFVATDKSVLLGTASIILDSPHGLPADAFRHDATENLRAEGETLAEISAFAIDKDRPHASSLVHFLVAFIFQYSFYYAAVDRFVVVCTPRHARFYERGYGFQRVRQAAFYDYVKVQAQMLTVNLPWVYESTKSHYQYEDPSCNFFRFMYRDEHPCMHFPPRGAMRRSRQIDWSAYAAHRLVAV